MFTILLLISLFNFLISHSNEIHLESRIANGVPSIASDYPFIASIRTIEHDFNDNAYTTDSFCGGSLLRKEYPSIILTAAHCVFNVSNTLIVHLQRTDTNDPLSSTNNFTQHIVIGYILHEEFDIVSLNNDVALLFLDADLINDSKLQTVSIPNYVNFNTECCSTLDKLQVIGYGRDGFRREHTSTLEYANVEYIDRTSCNRRLTIWETGQSRFIAIYANENTICGIGDNQDSSVCYGDSGGPLIKSGTNIQVGIVSWGLYCITSLPSMYTNLGLYYTWIDTKLKSYIGHIDHQFPIYPWTPTKIPTQNPSQSPTPSPTGNTIIIDGTWIDNVIVMDHGRGGWLTHGTNQNELLDPFLIGDEAVYHGPFQGNTEFNLLQYFYCLHQSTVHVTYSIVKCDTENTDHVILYFDDIEQQNNDLEGLEFKEYSDDKLQSNTNCNDFQYFTVDSIIWPMVERNEEFEIKFKIILSSSVEAVAIYHINITCNQFTTIIPSNHPTTNPTKYPSDNSSILNINTVSPTILTSNISSLITLIPTNEATSDEDENIFNATDMNVTFLELTDLKEQHLNAFEILLIVAFILVAIVLGTLFYIKYCGNIIIAQKDDNLNDNVAQKLQRESSDTDVIEEDNEDEETQIILIETSYDINTNEDENRSNYQI